MYKTVFITLLLLSMPIGTMAGEDKPIDRHALVVRHNIRWEDPKGQIPLGNGEFCFNADGTGLQTFGGSTLSHWAWHASPLPIGCTPDDLPATGTVDRGRIVGRLGRGAEKPELDGWMARNPHPVNLARLRFIRGDGTALRPEEIGKPKRLFNLWTGLHESRFEVDGQVVEVSTCVHPTLDLVAVEARSPLLQEGRLSILIDFPYPSAVGGPWAGDWNRPAAHRSDLVGSGEHLAVIRRTADDAVYHVSLAWSPGATFSKWPEARYKKKLSIIEARFGGGDKWLDVTDRLVAAVTDDSLAITPSYENLGDPLPGQAKVLQLSYRLDGEPRELEVREGLPLRIQTSRRPHAYVLRGDDAGRLAFVCGFAENPVTDLPTVRRTGRAAADHWKAFWHSGGVIDLSLSKDPRWRELERRIVLSQYHMAAQSAGSWPPAEIGLMGIDYWSSQFHMEMLWWHLAHYGLWDRWPLAERALSCYQSFLPVARQLAGQFGYQGARWGKQVGPEGRTAPWDCSFLLHWQQPHPLFFAELEYRLKPNRATLEKWRDVVMATAAYMADFPTRDDQGLYHLDPIMPPSEQGITRDTVFDLAYWRWGLDQAQRWRERLGLPREPNWDAVRRRLAPLPQVEGVFVHSAEWTDTYSHRNWEHPDPVGVLGMLPPLDAVDADTAHRTVLKVWRTWQWERCWGWDFPWMAMAAARVGEPAIAVEALLTEAGAKNGYDPRGVNTGGPCPYLPGNGGLLYAVAMMAGGWDGAPDRPAPGFPDDGQWVVRCEGLKPAP
jgi:hypothetical protein